MLKILQARLQQYMNREFPSVQSGFRKHRGTPDIKLPISVGSLKKQESSRKTSTSALLTMPKPLTVWITTNCHFSSVQLLSHVRLFVTPWTTACQASLSLTNYRSSLKLMSIESVMPSSRPLLLLPPIPPSIRVFSNESTLCMRWPKY